MLVEWLLATHQVGPGGQQTPRKPGVCPMWSLLLPSPPCWAPLELRLSLKVGCYIFSRFLHWKVRQESQLLSWLPYLLT